MNRDAARCMAMLKAKLRACAQAAAEHGHPDAFDTDLLQSWARWDTKPPTMDQLRMQDDPIECSLRRALPKETQEKIRAKLVAEFGISTVGEPFEVVSKRILERGSVANEEEYEACESFVFTMADYGLQELGVTNARRLGRLLDVFRSGEQS